MEQNNYNLGVRSAEGEAFSAGIAYVAIPSDVDRGKYIRECYRTSTVSIFSEHNGFNNRVPIDKFSINFIKFPDDVNKFGTAVSFVLDPIHKKPIIVGIYHSGDEISNLKENQFRFGREFKGKFIEIAGSSEEGYISLNVITDKGGKVSINVGSKDESGELDVKISGSVNITASCDTNIKQFGTFNLATIDKDNEEQFSTFEQNSKQHIFFDEQHNINTDKLSINDGEEPFLLGKKWASFMKDFIKEVGGSTVTTALGQMPLLNAEQILEFENKVDEVLSTIGFIDK